MDQRRTTLGFVITVYNKAPQLPWMLASLQNQTDPGIDPQYIFVDDASTDDSVQVLKAHTKNWPQVQIIENTNNKGPAVRLNQGIGASSAEYIQFLDADDLLPEGATQIMLRTLKKHHADFIYGQVRRSHRSPEELLKTTITPTSSQVFDHPLKGVLTRPCVGMALMARRTTLVQCGGADESLFVQDQSLPLRLGMAAQRFVYLPTVTLWAMPSENHLSSNLNQQHHDGFYAFYNALQAINMHNLKNTTALRQIIFQKMVSVLWKAKRGKMATALPFLPIYLLSKMLPLRPMGLGWLKGQADALRP